MEHGGPLKQSGGKRPSFVRWDWVLCTFECSVWSKMVEIALGRWYH